MKCSVRNLCLVILILAASGCAGVPPPAYKTETYASNKTNSTYLGQKLSGIKALHPDQSGFHLLSDPLDAFGARAVLVNQAQKTIDAQYYLFHSDVTGGLLAGMLFRAADRGVRVRLLIDDMALGQGDVGAINLSVHPNIEVRIFNPFNRKYFRLAQYITRFGRVTRRMHNKSITVDNQVTITGGRNIGDEYFGLDNKLLFGDLDVVAIGPVVPKVSRTFDLYWNHELAYPVESVISSSTGSLSLEKLHKNIETLFDHHNNSDYIHALQQSQIAQALDNNNLEYAWGHAEVIYDNPDKIKASRNRTDLHLITKLQKYSNSITDELIIFSPYFVPGKKGVQWIKALREKGVRVRILTNSLSTTDVAAVHAGYAKYRRRLLRAGVEIWEYSQQDSGKKQGKLLERLKTSKASLHAKSFVIDREKVFIGSLNLDPRSVLENTELGLIIEAEEIAEEMVAWFDQQVRNVAFKVSLTKDASGREKLKWLQFSKEGSQEYSSEPQASLLRRIGVNLLRLLPVESQL